MAKKKTTTKKTAVSQPSAYEVLIPCSNDATHKHFKIGDTVKDGDFSTAVLINWCDIDPPVLRAK